MDEGEFRGASRLATGGVADIVPTVASAEADVSYAFLDCPDRTNICTTDGPLWRVDPDDPSP
ncbi:hypothetical protein GCM10010924_39780 [Rhizobium wenxiniae]|nr:hypothetical protein GCM10010924_39780 [Rhizobium wenxiniae]